MATWKLTHELFPHSRFPDCWHFLVESPSREYAAIVYNVAEIGMDRWVGYFGILKGPTDSPEAIFGADPFPCLGSERAVRWMLNGQIVVVTAYLCHEEQQNYPLCFFDTSNRLHAYYPMLQSGHVKSVEATNGYWTLLEPRHESNCKSRDGAIVDPATLHWRPWTEIRVTIDEYWEGKFGVAT